VRIPFPPHPLWWRKLLTFTDDDIDMEDTSQSKESVPEKDLEEGPIPSSLSKMGGRDIQPWHLSLSFVTTKIVAW